MQCRLAAVGRTDQGDLGGADLGQRGHLPGPYQPVDDARSGIGVHALDLRPLRRVVQQRAGRGVVRGGVLAPVGQLQVQLLGQRRLQLPQPRRQQHRITEAQDALLVAVEEGETDVIAALLTCAVFSTASGIVGAVVTLMGLLAFPAMANANYNKSFASGVICAGGTPAPQ